MFYEARVLYEGTVSSKNLVGVEDTTDKRKDVRVEVVVIFVN